MSTKATYLIRTACEEVRRAGLQVKPGPWFEVKDGKPRAFCAIGAVLYTHGFLRPEHLTNLDVAARPGFVRAACKTLGVDPQWLYRFWMGFDRGHHITLVRDGDDKEVKCDVSGFGIQLRKELNPAL